MQNENNQNGTTIPYINTYNILTVSNDTVCWTDIQLDAEPGATSKVMPFTAAIPQPCL